MSREFIAQNVANIMNDNQWDYPQNIAMAGAWIMANFKGEQIKTIDVSKASTLADYYILCNATNTVQGQSIADEIARQLKTYDAQLLSVEGMSDADWILLDFGDVIFHIFQDYARDVYDLDTLWAKHPKVDIPESFYFGDQESEDDSSTRGYF